MGYGLRVMGIGSAFVIDIETDSDAEKGSQINDCRFRIADLRRTYSIEDGRLMVSES